MRKSSYKKNQIPINTLLYWVKFLSIQDFVVVSNFLGDRSVTHGSKNIYLINNSCDDDNNNS